MAVAIRTEQEIKIMREAGHFLARVNEELEKEIHPGMSTKDVDVIGERLIRGYGCTPSFLNYNGYPASICVSVNDEVVHGIPRKDHILREGDIVSLDAGLIYKGYHADAARTVGVGQISKEAQRLMDITKESFYAGLWCARAGQHVNDISSAVEDYVSQFGYGIVRDLVGHGIGRQLHEEPEVPNFRQRKKGIRLRPGMVLCIEPMINAGTWRVNWMNDGWTVVTADHSLSAHYENTVLITEGEPEILTLLGSD